MRHHCIAIGIDAYPDPGWQLGACAADAIAFAEWALGPGEVALSDLRLMVAPMGDLPAAVELSDGTSVTNYAPTRDGIMDFLLSEMLDEKWSEGDRLYFYFAGHGCSHEWVRGARSEPVLFPGDVKKLPLNSNKLISFEEMLSPLRAHGPKEQLIFIDACRDFALADYASTAGASPGRYLRPILDDAGCKQNILYATAPGERAIELGDGQGVFAKALIDGLRGHPAALQRFAGQLEYKLTFAKLAAYVRKTVETRVRRSLIDTPYRFVQAPEIDPDKRQPELVIASLPDDAVPEQPLFVRINPSGHCDVGQVDLYYERTKIDPPFGPPLKVVHEIPLKPRFYELRASAPPNLVSDQISVEVPYDGVIELELKPRQAHQTAESLTFSTSDRSMPIIVRTPDGKNLTEVGSVYLFNPVEGTYLAAAISPERPSEFKGYTFPACGEAVILDVAPPALSVVGAAALGALGMQPTQEAVHPSESLSPQAEFRLTSLLAFAAYATYSSRPEIMHKLRSIDLAPIDPAADIAWATILVGATGYQPVPGKSVEEFLAGLRAALAAETGGFDDRAFTPLKVPGTAQILMPCPEGSFSVELAIPGIPPTRFAMNGMKGRVSTLVVGVADDQALEVQHYMFSIGGGDITVDDLPIIEKAQRFFGLAQSIPEPIIDRMLFTKRTDPLVACLAGYALVRDGLRDRFSGNFHRDDPNWNPGSPLQNMLSHFGGLPDSHVLAGLCDFDRREEHFIHALERGLPLFADGFRALIDFFGAQFGQYPAEFDRARRTLSVGTAYSSWLSREPRLLCKESRFEAPPVQWRMLELHRDRIAEQLLGCGRVSVTIDDDVRSMGTGFLIAPDRVATADHVINQVFDENGELLPSAEIRFSTDDTSTDATGTLAKVIERDGATRIAILELATPLDPAYVLGISEMGRAAPGDPIYVIGYAFGSAFGGGWKHLLPGFILAAPDGLDVFDHDASTVAGCGGAPVIDAATGEVIGIHWGGLLEGAYKRNRASRFVAAAATQRPSPPAIGAA